MKQNILSRTYQVSDAARADAFSNPVRRRALLLLADRERALSELARDMDVELKRLHYHVTVLEKLGLVVVSRVVARAGRPIKIYAGIAASFFVPARFTAVEPGDALAVELRQALARARLRTRDGIVYDVGDSGQPRMRAVPGPEQRPARAMERWWNLSLTVAERTALAAAIEACIQPYVARDPVKGERCVVHCAFAPALPGRGHAGGGGRPNK
jgi:DNA-binding transcriptional ArsR family regulator